jgi:D-alanyl-D-alanine carboxypeptidase (penicillin-binding protein 5/6)
MGRASSGGASLTASINAKQQVEVASAAEQTDVPVPANAPRVADEAAAPAPKALGFANDGVVPLERPAAMDEIMNAGKAAKAPAGKTGGWQIQISAAPSADAARALLAQAQSEAGAPLVSASPYTEAVGKGANAIYRARFIGFQSKEDATSACDALKKRSYDCMLLPNQG